MPPDALLASCASEEGLEELFAGTASPGRVIGLSFFDPVESSRQIQITIGSLTTRLTAERLLALVNTLGKTPVVKGKPRSGA
jgi:3-hydroxybutyryl-CoA dehydrogenase